MKAFKLLPNEDDEDRLEAQARLQAAVSEPTVAPLPWRWTLLLWAGALLPRLYYLFLVSNPENAGDGWYGDVYHHWQIAYLTQQVGLGAPHGPRLWDLKGLEYFWGILHPIVMVGLFFVTGSIDIVLARLLSLAFGVLVVLLIFHLCRRHWGNHVAIAAWAFAALAPTSVFNDTSGMLESMGVGLSLLGIWLWPKRGVWTGIAWTLAAMARAEYWLLSIGLLIATYLRRSARLQRLPMTIAFAAGILLYMKVLLDKTGNPIYPVYWNFLANALGRWEYRPTLTPAQLAVRPVLGVILLLAAAGLALTLWKRPKSYMFLAFGFGYWVFTAGFLGFSAYLKSWEPWFWMIRFFVFPYEFAAVLGAIGLFLLVPRYLSKRAIPFTWLVGVAVLLAIQLEWSPILSMYGRTQANWLETRAAARAIGDVYQRPEYRGSVLNLPPSNPSLVYALARFEQVDGKHILGQLYDPFYYLPADYRYVDHPQVVGTLLQCWLAKTQTGLLLVEPRNENYLALIADHPQWTTRVGQVPGYQWLIEAVHLPPPLAQACEQAARSMLP